MEPSRTGMLVIFCVLTLWAPFGAPANILFFNAVGTLSTRISMWSYVEGLLEKGHNVTFMSPFSFDGFEETPGLRFYVPKKWSEELGSWDEQFNFYESRKAGALRRLQDIYDLRHFGAQACQLLYADPEYVEWIKSSHFDVIVSEVVLNECSYGLVHYYNAKLIVYSTTTSWPSFVDAFGVPDESASVPDVGLHIPAGPKMTFWQRVANALNPVVYTLVREHMYFPQLEEMTRKGLGIDNLPKFKDIENNASLVLVTTHFTLDYPRSYPPHVIPIGGVVVNEKNLKRLPQEMDNFIRKSKKGFVYISFGTVAEFTMFDLHVQKEFINALRKFPDIQFVWKSATEIKGDLPSNVYVTKWAPQQTLLAHSLIQAFITHSGMGSTAEAIYFGVPTISIPIMGDQDLNAATLVEKGAGLQLEILTLKAHELEHAISEILHNDKYREGMKVLSLMFKKRPAQPLHTALWWTEFVIRNDNIHEYLVPPGVKQPWWIKRQIDVWAFVVTSLLGVVALVAFLLCKIITTIFCQGGKSSSSKKSKAKLN